MNITEQRLQLLANGYSPIRNRDKRTFMKAWPTVDLTEAEIRSWERKFSRDKATGLRIEDGLVAIDFDINDETAMRGIANAVFERVPQLGDPDAALLVRNGKGFKEAWFVRGDEEFGRLHSRAWTPPGQSVDAGTHRVEIFGGASPRQFGALGPHTVTDDGVVEIEYRWPERSPLDTPKPELPELTKQQFFEIIDIVERVLAGLGWSPVLKSTSGENDAQRVYDLTDEMSFDLQDGQRLSLQQMRDLAHSEPDGGHRCSAAFFEGPSAINRTRCLIGVSRAGNLTIWDSAHGATHCEASLKPRDYAVDLNRIAEKLREVKDRRKLKIKDGDDALTAAGKLLQSMAFCPYQQLNVLPLWSTSMTDGKVLAQLRTEMQPFCSEEVGPRGGRVKISPVDIWLSSPDRTVVRGQRMRPDKERPIYEENGEKWINIYAPPVYDATGGSAATGRAFLEQLVPDAFERGWLTQWLAHKVRYPHIPGPAIVMVARDFGTGRGTFGALVTRLFGQPYVRQLPFAAFAGKTYQSQYNDWQATALVVMVNESSESDGSTYQTKRNTYEHLKELVEPAPIEREIYVKGLGNYRAVSYTSFIIATNHEDALPIPADDRRFFVLRNGHPRETEYWQEVRDWMDNDENMAAFHQWLSTEVDLAGFSPFAPPPKTEGKSTMVEAGRSDLDRAVDLAIESMAADVFVMEQLIPMVKRVAENENWELPGVGGDKLTAVIRKVATRALHKVGTGTEARVMIDGKRFYVWARTSKAAKTYATGPVDNLRRDILRSGSPAGSGLPGNLHLLPGRSK